MKKLICAKDVEEAGQKGETTIFIDHDTIITPSAQDVAKGFGISFSEEEKDTREMFGLEGMDNEKIYKVLKVLMEKGLLNSIWKPYEADSHPNGLKVVRGNTVQMDVFDTGTPGAKAYYQELVSKEESHISAGFLTIEYSKFEWELTYEEIDYVIEGTVTVTIDGKTYTGHAGDVLFIPAGSKVIWGSPGKAKLFFTTYPANWADLV